MTATASPRLWDNTPDNNQGLDGAANFPEGMAPSAVNDAARGIQAAVHKLMEDLSGKNVAGGTANAITLTTSEVMAAGDIADGLLLVFRAANANTGAATIAIDGNTAKSIYRPDGSTALAANDILAGALCIIGYSSAANSGAGGFLLLNPNLLSLTLLAASSTGVGTLMRLTSTDAGASSGPDGELFRDSASPAASDLIGTLFWYGRDSAANKQEYASLVASILDPTSTSEDGRLALYALIAGARTLVAQFGPGVVLGAPTGGDKGVGTINATGLYINGTAVSAGGGTAIVSVKKQSFTSSGTYTPSTGMVAAIIECQAPGGGGGGASNPGTGGCGGGGGWSRKLVSATDVGSSQTVTVGAVGAAGASGNHDGGTGGDTSVGALCVAHGGVGGGGGGSGTGGAGGAVGTGDITIEGQNGSSTISGISHSSLNGVPLPSAGNAGTAASTNGTGGSGANASGGSKAGGAGGPGYVNIYEFCTS